MKPDKLNPYTQAMVNCLQPFTEKGESTELDKTTSQFLANMIQGRFLQYMVTRICQRYEVTSKDLQKQLNMVMMTLLSDKFFAVFREKVIKKPEIVLKIARKITSTEMQHGYNSIRIDALYRGISRHYFDYLNFKIITRWINTNPDVEKIIFLSRIEKLINDTSLIKALVYILQNDKHGIVPTVFNRYLKKNKLERLSNLVRSGDWRIEASYIQKQSSKMINWREYMKSL